MTSKKLTESAVIVACILQTSTRQEILDYFDNTWTLTEVLFSGLLVSESLPSQTSSSFHLPWPL